MSMVVHSILRSITLSLVVEFIIRALRPKLEQQYPHLGLLADLRQVEIHYQLDGVVKELLKWVVVGLNVMIF